MTSDSAPLQKKTPYHVTDWKTYNKGLIERYNLNLWLSDKVIQGWYHHSGKKKRGAPLVYSKAALILCHQLRLLFGLSLRGTQGFLNSLFTGLGLSLRCPHYSQLCRRAKGLTSWQLISGQARHSIFALVDSTGLKVYGQGEWHVKMHKASKRRVWRKFHLVLDPISQEILAHKLTPSNTHDIPPLLNMLPKLPKTINRLWADGAYDGTSVYQALYNRRIHPTIPPPRNAVRSCSYRLQRRYLGRPRALIHPKPALRPRDAALDYCEQYTDFDEGRRLWKQHSSYHLRSLVETTIMRFKQLFTDRLRSRTWANQQAEVSLKCSILNKMIQIASAQSQPFPS